jgi:hypothetical protein
MKDDGFAVRTVMAMASEMAEARARLNIVCVQFEALAATLGVKVDWDNTTA